ESGSRIQGEAYPEMKADKQFLHLQKSVNERGERIAATRRTYNARVTKYNNLTQKFPTVMLATLLGFSSKELLQAPEEKKDNVELGAILRGYYMIQSYDEVSEHLAANRKAMNWWR